MPSILKNLLNQALKNGMKKKIQTLQIINKKIIKEIFLQSNPFILEDVYYYFFFLRSILKVTNLYSSLTHTQHILLIILIYKMFCENFLPIDCDIF